MLFRQNKISHVRQKLSDKIQFTIQFTTEDDEQTKKSTLRITQHGKEPEEA